MFSDTGGSSTTAYMFLQDKFSYTSYQISPFCNVINGSMKLFYYKWTHNSTCAAFFYRKMKWHRTRRCRSRKEIFSPARLQSGFYAFLSSTRRICSISFPLSTWSKSVVSKIICGPFAANRSIPLSVIPATKSSYDICGSISILSPLAIRFPISGWTRFFILQTYSFINTLSDAGIPFSSDTYRSTLICKSYFSRSSVIFAIIGEAWWTLSEFWSFQLSIKSTVS